MNALLEKIYELAKASLTEKQAEELVSALSSQPEHVLELIANNEFDYCEVHVHSEYSLLDGVGSIKNNILRAAELGHKALAITDHRVTHGWFAMREAEKHGIKPLFGCEVDVRDGEKSYHCVMIAMNTVGYRNLLHIVSEAHMNSAGGMKPSVAKSFIAEHSDGIIVTTACLGGILNRKFMDGATFNELCEETKWWIEHFPDRLYIELQNYDVENMDELEDFQKEFILNQRRANGMMVQIAKHFNLPLICTNDVHYPRPGDHLIQDILLCINLKEKLDNPNRLRFSTNLHYMKDKWEMLWRFRHYPEAVFNTQRLADRCNIEYQKEYLLPDYPDLPEGEDPIEFFKKMTHEGLKKFYLEENNIQYLVEKFNEPKEKVWKERIIPRAKYEIDVLVKMGFTGYILDVAWVMGMGRSVGILFGPGRGSAAGSILAVAHGIVRVCPLRYDLLFERFLNPDRIEMPDIDIDIQDDRRSELIDMVQQKLGYGKLSQIVTFGKMKARAAIRNVGTVLGVNLALVDKIAKMVPFQMSITKALETVPEFKKQYDTNETVKRLIDLALMIEGKPKNYSVHAAGVIMSNDDIRNHAAFQHSKKAVLPVIQAEMGAIDGLRLVKQDFLGLRTLSVIMLAIDLIAKRCGVQIDPLNIPKDDPKTYEMLARGESIACFQLESKGMRQLLKDLKVEKFEDIVDVIALYRPGVLKVGMHTEYIKNKFNPDGIKYIHPSLKEILEATRGILIYQEQAMLFAHRFAGFSMAQADALRKAIGKKIKEKMQELKSLFIEGCIRVTKMDKETAEKIWRLIEVMAEYSFNKSHSVAYGTLSVETAYLKANFPLEYMTAAIAKAAEAKSPKVPVYIEEARRMGIEVVSPDINLSDVDFSIHENKIVFGLRAIRDVGKSSELIVEEREKNGPFTDIINFRERLPKVNKKALEALVKAGCFDSLGLNRNQILAKMDEILKIKPKKAKGKAKQAVIELPDFDDIDYNELRISFPDIPSPTKEELAELEDLMFGIYINHHPLAPHKEKLDDQVSFLAEDLEEVEENREVYVGGLIREKKIVYTKKDNSEMAIYTIDDLSGTFSVVAFPRQYASMKEFEEKDIVLIKGTVQYKEKFSSPKESDNDDENDNENEKEYVVQIIAQEMVRFSDDAVTKLSPLKEKFPQQEQHFSPKTEKRTTLSEYLKSQGNRKLVVL